ncbi:MAG: HD domain-containing phosphohydrolase [bacterium]
MPKSRLLNAVRRLRPRGVRTKLLLSFIGLVFFTTLVIHVLTIRTARHMAYRGAIQNLSGRASFLATSLGEEIREAADSLALAKIRVRGGRIAPETLRSAGRFRRLAVFDAEGNLLASSPGGDADEPDGDTVMHLMRKAAGAGIPCVLPSAGSDEKLHFYIAVPGGSGRAGDAGAGITVGKFRFRDSHFARMAGLPPPDGDGVHTTLVEENGTVRFSTAGNFGRIEDVEPVSPGSYFSLRAAPEVERDSGSLRHFMLDGERHMGVAAAIPDVPGWALVVHEPYGKVFEDVGRLSVSIALISLLALVIAVFLGLYRSHRIVRPLSALISATEEISQGEYSKRVAVRSNDEMGKFAYAFNRMTGVLEEKINQHREAQERLEEAYNQLKTDSKKRDETARALHQKMQELVSLGELTRAITTTMDLDSVLETIADLIHRVMNFDTCAIKLLNRKTGTLHTSISRGLGSLYLQKAAETPVGEGISGVAVKMCKPIVVEDVDADQRLPRDHVIRSLGIKSLVSYPLITKKEVVGVMNLYTRYRHDFIADDDEKLMLEIFANQAASAIENARLFESLRESYLNTVQALSMAIDAKDQYTLGHSKRVSDVSLLIGEQMGLNPEELELLRHAGDLHDIGKIGISELIISKKDKLTVEEYEIIKTHPLVGETIIEPVPFLQDIRRIIRHHHERWDGYGYPDGLRGEEIPLLSRIILVSDAYDSMTSDRPYRRALSHERAVSEIGRHSGTQFDPAVVKAFLAIMEKKTPEEIMLEREAGKRRRR